jgi:two-component system, NtrC family, nitrogen regulation response regulator NtrX
MMDTPRKVLIVDDERDMLTNCTRILRRCGYECLTAETSAQGLALVQSVQPDVVLVDLRMPGKSGIDIVKAVKSQHPHIEVVLMTAYATIETAVDAIKQGAFDYLPKPFTAEQLQAVIQGTLRRKPVTQEARRMKGELARPDGGEMMGNSEAMAALRERIRRIAATEATVLITGESGTGKELVARALHRVSTRSERPFVEVNCAAIPSELIESELFGHVKGSFTGAFADRAGKFEQADGGTLFLDEVGDMSLAAQAKVLRALQEGVVTRIGGERSIKVDVRVIAATNKNVEQEIESGRFREDLFFRLNVVPLHIPPLRERREDVPMLIRHFVETATDEQRLPRREFSPEAVERMVRMDWPGNVRELRNTVERLMILARGAQITEADIDRLVGGARGDSAPAELLGSATFSEFKERAERAYLLAKLREHDWNVSETARSIRMPRSNLYKKIERYGLVREEV